MDYIQFQNIQTEEYAQVLMLRDLERLFRKSRSSLEKYGFPKPNSLPTELQCEVLQWQNEEEMQRQRVLLASLNSTCPNNSEQQRAFESIMNSIHDFTNANREETAFILLADQVEQENRHCLKSYTLRVVAWVC